jgi:DMSO/TMAO reductase YedYZ molybdopterin-dependent catalytic subunit
MVAQPTSFSLADLRQLPQSSQITEVVCEEGWSYVAEWIGTPLSGVVKECGAALRCLLRYSARLVGEHRYG